MFKCQNLLIVAFLLVILSVICVNSAKKRPNVACPQIKLKRQWGGKPSKRLDYQVRPINYVIIHHTVTPECNTFVKCSEILQNMQYYHQTDLDYNDIGYNFLIGGDGIVYEGTGWGVTGAHTYGYNKNGTGIAFIGNFVEKLPTNAALEATKKLLACGVQQEELSRNYKLLGGSQVISSQSPGLTLYNEIQEWKHWTPEP